MSRKTCIVDLKEKLFTKTKRLIFRILQPQADGPIPKSSVFEITFYFSGSWEIDWRKYKIFTINSQPFRLFDVALKIRSIYKIYIKQIKNITFLNRKRTFFPTLYIKTYVGAILWLYIHPSHYIHSIMWALNYLKMFAHWSV